MIKLSFLLLLFNITDRVEHNIDSLRKQGADTFMIFQLGSSGRIDPPCPPVGCCDEEPVYLCYAQQGKYFLKKIRLCSNPAPILLPEKNALSFYIAHREKINTEEIKPVECRPPYLAPSVSHVLTYHITAIIGNDRVMKTINTFDLNYKSEGRRWKNIHYKYNQHTQLKTLADYWNNTLTHHKTTPFFDAFNY